MIRQIYRYLYPQRKLHRVPKRVSAEYDRAQMEPDAQLCLMSGLARDPAGALAEAQRLREAHGDEWHQHLHLELRRKRNTTASQRAWMLIRQILGESEPRKVERRRPVDPIVKSKYKLPEEH